ncbi:MAG: hypothetical protein ACRECZ_06435, partial [Methylocella sp.]
HCLCFGHVFAGQSQCFTKRGVRLAKARANPGKYIPRCLQLFLRTIEIIASKRQGAEGAKCIRLAKTRANPAKDIQRRTRPTPTMPMAEILLFSAPAGFFREVRVKSFAAMRAEQSLPKRLRRGGH